jgi:hypothetical protein
MEPVGIEPATSWVRFRLADSPETEPHGPVLPSVPMTKTELHRLVDALPDESLPAAAILLRRAQDPVAVKLDAAPYDDEELTDEDLSAVREARSEPGVAWSDTEAELTLADLVGWRIEVRPRCLEVASQA